MHRYVPSRERLKEEWRHRTRKKKPASVPGLEIPDNSSPWSDSPPRTLHDLVVVCDKIQSLESAWKKMQRTL